MQISDENKKYHLFVGEVSAEGKKQYASGGPISKGTIRRMFNIVGCEDIPNNEIWMVSPDSVIIARVTNIGDDVPEVE